MKKVLCTLAAIAIVATISTSCKKTCNCETTTTGVSGSISTTAEIKKGKCSDLNTEATIMGSTTKMTCK